MTLTVLQGSNLYTLSPTLSTCTAMDFVRLRGEEHRFSMPVKMILCVYSRSDKHLISKMEKPKVANFNWNFLVKACYSFLLVSFFQAVCLVVSQKS